MNLAEALICQHCGAIMTDEERHYSGIRCDACEWAWLARIERWRHGGPDEELDKTYSVPEPTKH